MKLHTGLKWGCLAPVCALTILIISVAALDALLPSSAKRSLPKSASNIQEYYSDSWNGDFVRLLRADLPEQDYEIYTRSVNLSESYDPTKHADIKTMIEMGIGDAPSWWTPPPASDTTLFEYQRGDDYLRVLSYSDGTVYYLITSW